jgi:hypothetical protein
VRPACGLTRLVLVPGAGHCDFLERPERFNEISLDFIAIFPPIRAERRGLRGGFD